VPTKAFLIPKRLPALVLGVAGRFWSGVGSLFFPPPPHLLGAWEAFEEIVVVPP